ncbi:hypothetical protein BOX15_Mlig010588g3 [Macrostomum lignano]|uniref:Uncharacterized protein n=1 Tax=Macrostomum lignano TaxID=282301 RepID=A0A267G151_9PLAT|nr:hypothetical protein BOX15_Mlig010588g3 [Macrostomum lignano]
MLRSDYKYSREPAVEAATDRRDGGGCSSGINDSGCSARQASPSLLLTPGAAAAGTDNDGEDGSSGGGKRGGSMKHWSPLAALGKRARDGLRRCNTVRAGLGGGASSSSTTPSAADLNLSSRRNAMPNIFLGLPSSGVRRLFAIYGIDDSPGGRAGSSGTHSTLSPTASSTGASTAASSKGEESLFARHSRTSSVRSRRLPNFGGPMQQQQHQHMLMMQQHQQHLLVPPQPVAGPVAHHPIDKRRASSMRDHQGRQHRKASSCHGNW